MSRSRQRSTRTAARRGNRTSAARRSNSNGARRSSAAARRGTITAASRRRAPTAGGRGAPKLAANRRSAKMTTDHEEIRRWTEARGGTPATVKRTAKGRQAAGILRIDFPGFSGAQSLKPISWDEWFDTFEERRLAFLYQNKTASGKPSRFNKLVCRTERSGKK